MASPGKLAFEAALAEIEAQLKALQVRYEQYFLGIERIAPEQDRDALKRSLQHLRRSTVRNTAQKFRLNSLWNKFLSYERMWGRTTRDIEEGRYHRDVFKAKLRSQAYREQHDKDGKKKAPSADDAAGSSANGTQSARARAEQARQPAGDGLSADHVKRLHQAFITAKKRCGEDTSGLSLEAMHKSLAKQIPAIKAKHKAKAVDFKVVIRNGKAVLKAVPK